MVLAQQRKAPAIQSHNGKGALFKSSYVKGKCKESQITQGRLPATKLAVVILFYANKGIMYFGTYWGKALIFFSLTHKLAHPDEI